LGTRLKSRDQIHEYQELQLLKAFAKRKNIIDLTYKDAFFDDPVNEIKKINDYIISIKYDISKEEINQLKKKKEQLINELESIRKDKVNDNITYEQQLYEEYKGYPRAYLKQFSQITSNQINSVEDFFQARSIGILLSAWKRYNGKPKGLTALKRYFNSEYYKSIPFVDISARLYAYIVTSPHKIKSGDSMDVEQISAVLPYCNYIFTDKRMENIIGRLNIDNDYNTKVFSSRNFNELIKEIREL
jgi:uncharacterized protein YdcH (DUF465 family)